MWTSLQVGLCGRKDFPTVGQAQQAFGFRKEVVYASLQDDVSRQADFLLWATHLLQKGIPRQDSNARGLVKSKEMTHSGDGLGDQHPPYFT